MFKKLRNKIEKKRNSKSPFLRFLIFSKDLIWKMVYFFKIIRINNVKAIFENIYKMNLWGGSDFFPGVGSLPENTLLYIEYVEKFIKENNIKSIVDLGCGDFRLWKKIDWDDTEYIGIDIVGSLIEWNNKLYSNSKIRFIQKNIITDKLPDADLCLIRTVFQHLPNRAILKIIPKLKKYKYVLITDCLPAENQERVNYDIPMGAGTRPKGLYLELPPFNLKVKTVLGYLRSDKKEVLRTVMMENKIVCPKLAKKFDTKVFIKKIKEEIER